MLCSVCISVFQGPSTDGGHHFSFVNLQKAADLGCKICSCLCRRRRERGPDTAAEEITNPFTAFRFESRNKTSPPEGMWLSFRSPASWLSSRGEDCIALHVSPHEPTPDWWPRFLEDVERDVSVEAWRVREDGFANRPIPTHTGDVEVAKLALEWFDICRHSHATCEAIDESESRQCEWFPERILDVGSLELETCRLILTGFEKPVAGSRYAALSHCWGDSPSFLTLTSDNMPTLQQNISTALLPRSFKDVILSCRRLGIRYLWIDSLCIIQSGLGSHDDWQKHGAEMDTVYSNSVLNISVDHASDPNQGAFVDRDPRLLQTTSVYSPSAMNLYSLTDHPGNSKLSNPNSDADTVASHGGSGTSGNRQDGDKPGDGKASLVTIFDVDCDFQSAFHRQPLQRRGWVFQERLMAPRVLHFGRDRIYWECNETHRDEYLPRGLPSSGKTFDAHWQKHFNLPERIFGRAVLEERLKPDVNTVLNLWGELVEDYSRSDLTFPHKDKLVAFAAIAKRFGRVLPGPYCAGLFRAGLPLDLLWQSYYGAEATTVFHTNEGSHSIRCRIDGTRDAAYRAPSWSWASLDTGSGFSPPAWAYRGHSTQVSWCTLAGVESVTTELADTRNPYGQVLSAELIISGPLLPFSALETPEATDACFDGQALFGLCIMEDIRAGHGDRERKPISSTIYGIVLAQEGTGIYRRVAWFDWQRAIREAASDSITLAEYRRKRVKIV